MSSLNLTSSSSSDSVSSCSNSTNFIEHHVSKMDTLAGVAIKYGVEVADIKRMNGLVTDLQMFALKTLLIPSPGRHPPSPCLSKDPATPGESNVEQIPPCRARSGLRDPFQSFGLKTPQRRVSPAMSSLQGYYGLKPPNPKSKDVEEGTEMSVYRIGRAHYLEDESLSKTFPLSETPSRKHKSRSLVNGFLPGESDLANDAPVADAGDAEADKSGEKSVRRRQKADGDTGSRTAGATSNEDNSGGNGFSGSAGKGPAMRPKSGSRNSQLGDGDIISWLNPIPVGLGDSLMADGFAGFRKSSSTSNLQDSDSNGSSIWPTSRWKPDLQSLSAAAIARPIFDGLPKPGNGRKNKAALD